MDNQPLPPLQLFNFTDEQLRMLDAIYQHVTVQLAGWQFNEPANDQLMMRQHAAIAGHREGIRQLIEFDDVMKKQAEERLAAAFPTINPEDN